MSTKPDGGETFIHGRRSDHYRCGGCGGVFPYAWSDEEARTEADELFAAEIAAGMPMAVVCDACFKAMGFGR